MSTAQERARHRIEQFREQRKDAAELARLASLAVRAEAQLLRTLRLELLPHADVGAEADLWFSPLVESRGTEMVVLEREVAAWLRQSLVGDELLPRVIEITRQVHESSPPSIRLEEEVNGLALERGEAALPEIDAALRRAIRTMRENDERAREIARWILRAAPRLHPIVLKSPSAIALVLGASMLLGRRGQGPGVEADVGLDDLGWILPPGVLSDRTGIDVERTQTGLRFVTPASGSGQLSLPRTDPLLIEVRWKDTAAADRAVVIDVSPGRTFALPHYATDVRIITVAGDEYEIILAGTPASAPETAQMEAPATEQPADDVPWADLSLHERTADACVRVATTTEPPRQLVGFWISPIYIVTARTPLRGETMARVGPDSPTQLALVLDTADFDEVITLRLESGGAFTEPVELASAPFLAARTTEQGPLESQGQNAVVLGYDPQNQLRAIEGYAEVTDFGGNAFRVIVPTDTPERLPDVLGGPVIIDGKVRGIITEVHQPRTGEEATILSAIGSVVLRDLIRRVAEAERRAQPPPPPAQSRAPQTEAPPSVEQVPAWARDACVEVHGLGDNLTPASGIAIDARRIVTAATFAGVPIVSVHQGRGSAQANVLEPATQRGVLVLEHAPLRYPDVGTIPGPLAPPLRPIEIGPPIGPSDDPVFQATEFLIVGSQDGRTFALRGERTSPVVSYDELLIHVRDQAVPSQVMGAAVFAGERFAGIITENRGVAPPASGRRSRGRTRRPEPEAGAVLLRATTHYVIRDELDRLRRQDRSQAARQTRGESYRFARVAVLGDPGSGRSALINALAGQRYDQNTRRAIWWLDAGDLRAGIVLHEVLSDEAWPIAFDLEHAAAAIIAEDVHGANTMTRWLRRVRSVRPDLPVLFAATKADSMDEDVKSGLLEVESLEREDLRSRGIESDQVFSTVVSAARDINIDRLRAGLRSRIQWSSQPELPREGFERARARVDRLIQPVNTILPAQMWDSTWREDANWLNPVASVIGVRRLPGADIVVEDPRQFEQLVTALVGIVRQGGLGVPARPMSEVEALLARVISVQDADQDPSQRDPAANRLAAELVRGVVEEVLRIGEAVRVDTDQGLVLVMPRWIGPAPGKTMEQTGVILRASWAGRGPANIAGLAAKFAFSNQNSLREAGWDAADRLGRIHALVASGMPLFVEVTESGPSTELVAEIPVRVPEEDAYTPTRLLRDWLDELMPGQVDARVEEFRGGRGGRGSSAR